MNQIEYAGLVFTDGDEHYEIKSAKCRKVCALMSDALEVDTFDLELISDTPLVPFTRNAPLVWYHRERLIGTYYVQSVRRTRENVYRIDATSVVGLLVQTEHYGGIYNGQTVHEVVSDICNIPVLVKTNLRDIKLYGWLPIASRRDNLSQVLFAIGATAKTDYDGVLRIEGLWDDASSDISAERMYADGSIDYSTPVTSVVVTEHQYSQGVEDSTLFDGTAMQDDIIRFSEPIHSLVATGFNILDSGANYARLSAGNGILTGKKYIHATRQIGQTVQAQNTENTVSVAGATLVSLANSDAVSARLKNYYAHSERIINGVLTKSEIPGDVVDVAHPYGGGTVRGCIESAEITMSGKLKANETILLGYIPLPVGQMEYFDHISVVDQSGTWTVPEGVTTVRIVAIGGGDKGTHGAKGGDTAPARISFMSGLAPARHEGFGLSAGGVGGDAGTGGLGGRILQVTLRVTAGDVIPLSIGVGGTANRSATDSTFGTLTTADGARADAGYTDPFTGEVYAANGADGIRGGNGAGYAGGTVAEDTFRGFTPADVVIDEDGVSWVGGQTISADGTRTDIVTESAAGTTHNLDGGYVRPVASGALGGGAAAGMHGANGDSSGVVTVSGGGSSRLRATAQTGRAKDGASATKVPRPAVRGCGGRGGYGGGGAGSPGIAIMGKLLGAGVSEIIGDPTEPTGGIGGEGSEGGDGGDGRILIYYSLPKPRTSGQFMTRDGLKMQEKYTREVVV